MNNTTVLERRIEHPKYGAIRAVYLNGQTWVYACDIARIMGLDNKSREIIKALSDDEYTIRKVRGFSTAYICNRTGFWHMMAMFGNGFDTDFSVWMSSNVFIPSFWEQDNIEASRTINQMIYGGSFEDAAKALESIQHAAGVLGMFLEDIEPKARMAEAIITYLDQSREEVPC